MTIDRRTIDDFLAQDRLAFVGASRDPKAFANALFRHLRDGGRTVIPVHRTAAELEGAACVRTLADLPGAVGGVVVAVGAENAVGVVREAIAAGIPRVWLHRGAGQGSVSDEAIELCRQAGVSVVPGACAFMFDAPVRGIHRLHRAISGRRIAA